MPKIKFQKVAIIGVGLIGGSIGLEIIRKKMAKEVVGFSRSKSNLRTALKKRLITHAAPSLFEAVVDAELIIIAAPVLTTIKMLREVLHLASPGCLVMDVGSTKVAILEEAEKYLPRDVFFVGAHPMAGREISGPQAAIPDLFKNRSCILTSLPQTPPAVMKLATQIWKSVGMKVRIMSAAKHDEVIGALSHLPQMAAYALMNTISSQSQVMQALSGNGLRDTTRLAASEPQMWLDICFTNKKPLLKGLSDLEKNLKKISNFIRQGNQKALRNYFKRANKLKLRLDK